jgi:hypothetical protein
MIHDFEDIDMIRHELNMASSRKAADLAGPNCCKADVEQNSNFLYAPNCGSDSSPRPRWT